MLAGMFLLASLPKQDGRCDAWSLRRLVAATVGRCDGWSLRRLVAATVRRCDGRLVAATVGWSLRWLVGRCDGWLVVATVGSRCDWLKLAIKAVTLYLFVTVAQFIRVFFLHSCHHCPITLRARRTQTTLRTLTNVEKLARAPCELYRQT